jgi:hypothetical protein
MPDVATILLSGAVRASTGGLVTWLLSPWVAERQARAIMDVQRPQLKGVFPGWGVRGPEVVVFNFGGRKTTVTDVGFYAADGSLAGPLWAIYEAGIEQETPSNQGIDSLHPPEVSYLPKVIDAGDFIEIPLAASFIADVVFGGSGFERRGLSGFWVKEADGTITRVPIDSVVLQGFLEWLPAPRPAESPTP